MAGGCTASDRQVLLHSFVSFVWSHLVQLSLVFLLSSSPSSSSSSSCHRLVARRLNPPSYIAPTLLPSPPSLPLSLSISLLSLERSFTDLAHSHSSSQTGQSDRRLDNPVAHSTDTPLPASCLKAPGPTTRTPPPPRGRDTATVKARHSPTTWMRPCSRSPRNATLFDPRMTSSGRSSRSSIIIQNLQKDLAKVTTERDLLRDHLTAEHTSLRSNSLNSLSSLSSSSSSIAHTNAHLSKRSLDRERRPTQDREATQPVQQLPHPSVIRNGDQDVQVASTSSIPTNISAPAEEVAAVTQETASPSLQTAHPPPNSSFTPLEPAHTAESGQIQAVETLTAACQDDSSDTAFAVSSNDVVVREHGQLLDQPPSEGEPSSRSSLDTEVQVASTANLAHHHPASIASPVIVLEGDTRSLQSVPPSSGPGTVLLCCTLQRARK